MSHEQARPKTRPIRFQFHRLKAALSLRERALQDFWRSLPVSQRHAQFVLCGQRRGSHKLHEAIRRALGDAAWSFVTGQSNTLRDEGSSPAEGSPCR